MSGSVTTQVSPMIAHGHPYQGGQRAGISDSSSRKQCAHTHQGHGAKNPDLNHGASHSCNICFDDIAVPEFISPESENFKYGLTSDGRHVRLACGHAFCKECTEGLLGQGSHDCPTCRTPIHDRALKAINKDLETGFKPRTARDVMNDVVQNDRLNSHNDDVSRENRGLWGFDVVHTENERNPQQPRQYEPQPHTAFLDDLLDEFSFLDLLSPSRRLDSWFDDMTRDSGIEDLFDVNYTSEPTESHSYIQPEPDFNCYFASPMGTSPFARPTLDLFDDFNWFMDLYSPRQPAVLSAGDYLFSPGFSFHSPSIPPLLFLF